MADDITTRIIFDDSQVVAGLSNMNTQLERTQQNFDMLESESNAALKKMKKNVDDADKSVDQFNKDIKESAKDQKAATESTKLWSGAIGSVSQGLESAGGQLGEFVTQLKAKRAALAGVVSGVRGVVTGMKVLKAALISTGIGAIVVALGSLVALLTKTTAGAHLMERAFAGVTATINVIIGRAAILGTAIVKLFQGDFKGAAEAAKESISGVREEILATVGVTDELTKQSIRLRAEFRKLRVEEAEGRKEIAKLKQVYEDTTQSIEDRIAAAQRANDIEQGNIQRTLKAMRDELRITEDLAKQRDSEDDLEKIADLKVEIANKELESLEKQIEIQNALNNLRREGEAQQLLALKRIREEYLDGLEDIPDLTREQLEAVKSVFEEVNPFESLSSPDPDIPEAVSKFKLLGEKIKELFASDDFGKDIVAPILDISNSIADGIISNIDREIDQNQLWIDSLEERRSALESELQEEEGLRAQGLANAVNSRKAELEALQAEEEAAAKRQAELEARRVKAQNFQDNLQAVSKIGLAVASLIAKEASKGIIGLAIAAGAIPLIFKLVNQAKSQATQSFYKGGFLGGDGNSWRNDRYGRGHRVEDSNVVLGGDEFVINGRTTAKQRPFLEMLNRGFFDSRNLAEEMRSGFRSRDALINKRKAERDQQMLNEAFAYGMGAHSGKIIDFMAKQGQYYSYSPGDKIVHVTPTKKVTVKG